MGWVRHAKVGWIKINLLNNVTSMSGKVRRISWNTFTFAFTFTFTFTFFLESLERSDKNFADASLSGGGGGADPVFGPHLVSAADRLLRGIS